MISDFKINEFLLMQKQSAQPKISHTMSAAAKRKFFLISSTLSRVEQLEKSWSAVKQQIALKKSYFVDKQFNLLDDTFVDEFEVLEEEFSHDTNANGNLRVDVDHVCDLSFENGKRARNLDNNTTFDESAPMSALHSPKSHKSFLNEQSASEKQAEKETGTEGHGFSQNAPYRDNNFGPFDNLLTHNANVVDEQQKPHSPPTRVRSYLDKFNNFCKPRSAKSKRIFKRTNFLSLRSQTKPQMGTLFVTEPQNNRTSTIGGTQDLAGPLHTEERLEDTRSKAENNFFAKCGLVIKRKLCWFF